MATPTYEFSGVVYTATADQTTFALTTDTGRSIGYLKFEHIHVRVSTDDGENWVNLVYTDDWVFADPTTSIVLNTPVAAGTLVDIHRTTPMEDDYIDFQKGSLLTAGQLNEFDTWQLYVDQELNDKTLSLEGDLSSLAVTQIIAGDNITINPEDGKGPVTINAADPPVTRIIAGEYVELNPASGLGDVTVNVLPPPGGLTYKGPIDATGPAPSDPQDGDLYINTAESGVVGSSWTGIAGTELVGAERLIYGGDTSPNQWSLLENPGVPEAPSDGEIYGRSDEEWVAIEGFPEAPEDGDIYGRSNADWVAIEGFPEAPQDGEVYGRSNGGWVVIPPGTVVSETAPADPAEGQQWWADSDVQDGGGRLYIYTGEEWVDTSLPGVGADFDETKAEELFLKLDASNDPVTGNCEFTAGVNVTGGKLGVGVTSPDAKLEVAGNAYFGATNDSYVAIYDTAFGGSIEAFDKDDSSTKRNLFLNAFGGRIGIGTETPLGNLEVRGSGFVSSHISSDTTNEAQLRFETNIAARVSNQSDAALIFETNATERMRITNNGKVGIGSNSPSEKLVLAEVAEPAGFSDTAISMIRSNYGGRIAGYLDQGVGHGITFDTIDSATPTERMRITGAGHVGIGTSPSTLLDVGGIASFRRSASSDQLLELSCGSGGNFIKAISSSNNVKPLILVNDAPSSSIRFVTGGSESARILSTGGLTFNGDTAASNALDDYEEGLWTPSFAAGTWTYTNQDGRYTKIGDVIYITGAISWNEKSGSGNLSVFLPFTTVGAVQTTRYTGSIGYMQSVNSSGMSGARQIVTSVSGNRSGMGFWKLNSGGNPDSLTVADLGTAGEVQFTITIKGG